MSCFFFATFAVSKVGHPLPRRTVYFAGSDCRYSHIPRNSSSVMWLKSFHGMNSVNRWPEGVTPLRTVATKSASDHFASSPPHVIFGTGGAEGFGSLPPARPAPWQVAQPLTLTRYSPYWAVAPDSGARGRGPARPAVPR